MIDINQYLEETNTVLLTKESFEYLKEKANALDKIRDEIEQVIDEKSKFDKKWAQALKIIDEYLKESENKE